MILTIYDGCNSIGESSFESCELIEKNYLELGKSVKLNRSSFKDCINVKEINFLNPNNTEISTLVIKDEAFMNCWEINSFEFPEASNVELGASIFENC